MKIGKFVGAVLLIAGTAIGAGMLALPVSTAAYGFFPSCIMFLVCWGFMLYTALLILEINRESPIGANLITMAKQSLGKPGQAVAWITYLMLLYALMAAYLSGMNALIDSASVALFGEHLSQWVGTIILIALFSTIIYFGATPIDYLNRFLMTGLVIAFFALAIFLTPEVNSDLLMESSFNGIWATLPIIIVAFGFHIVIPSLHNYLGDDVKHLRKAILVGSCAPIITYILWISLIQGTIPITGEHGLLAILESGQPAAELTRSIESLLHAPIISIASRFYTFFAIATSFIGVSFSLFDFLADGFHIKKTKLGRISTAIITFLPPLIFALYYPRGFIMALNFGAIFVAILLGVLPICMAWSARYRKNISRRYQVFGGKPMLLLALVFFIAVIAIDLYL